jgi:hypothetical protein
MASETSVERGCRQYDEPGKSDRRWQVQRHCTASAAGTAGYRQMRPCGYAVSGKLRGLSRFLYAVRRSSRHAILRRRLSGGFTPPLTQARLNASNHAK